MKHNKSPFASENDVVLKPLSFPQSEGAFANCSGDQNALPREPPLT